MDRNNVVVFCGTPHITLSYEIYALGLEVSTFILYISVLHFSSVYGSKLKKNGGIFYES